MNIQYALSIRQPWAWLILHGGKDIENRSWYTNYRGRFLIHAAKGCTRNEYEDAVNYAKNIDRLLPGLSIREHQSINNIPAIEHLERGGIIGSVELVDCVSHSQSKWFFGRYGFVLRNPEIMPFRPYKGELKFFKVSL